MVTKHANTLTKKYPYPNHHWRKRESNKILINKNYFVKTEEARTKQIQNKNQQKSLMEPKNKLLKLKIHPLKKQPYVIILQSYKEYSKKQYSRKQRVFQKQSILIF